MVFTYPFRRKGKLKVLLKAWEYITFLKSQFRYVSSESVFIVGKGKEMQQEASKQMPQEFSCFTTTD